MWHSLLTDTEYTDRVAQYVDLHKMQRLCCTAIWFTQDADSWGSDQGQLPIAGLGGE